MKGDREEKEGRGVPGQTFGRKKRPCGKKRNGHNKRQETKNC